MAIRFSCHVKKIDQQSFHQVDYQVMGVAFDIHNQFGRFRVGKDQVVKDISIANNGKVLGKQKVHLLTPNTAFEITGITKDIKNYERHLNKFIQLTTLNAIQWVNFNHNKISFKTIRNSKNKPIILP